MAELIVATEKDDLDCVGCGKRKLAKGKQFKDGIRCEECEICEECGTDENLGTLTETGEVLCVFCAG